MSTSIYSAGSPLSEGDVAALEQELGHRLPADYREFLLKFNGGRTKPDLCPVPGHPESPADVQLLFGLTDKESTSTLRWNLDVFRDQLDARQLPIACDSFGHIYCLWVAGRKRGVVEYLDRDGDPPRYYRVARSFSEFLGSLEDE